MKRYKKTTRYTQKTHQPHKTIALLMLLILSTSLLGCRTKQSQADDLEINNKAQITPTHQHIAMANGDHHFCVLNDIGQVECWLLDKEYDFGQIDAPDKNFKSISAGRLHTCGVTIDKYIHCWGNYPGLDFNIPEEPGFVEVSVGDAHACGLKEDNSIQCWGHNDFGQTSSPSGDFISVSAGWRHSCGLKSSGEVTCWGVSSQEVLWDYGQTRPPVGEFTYIRAGTFHSCALDSFGQITCWGLNDVGQTDVPDGNFIEIAIGFYHTCALSYDGDVVCWGVDEGAMDFQQSRSPEGQFTSISGLGHHHHCGLRIDGDVVCWGRFTGSPPGINEKPISMPNLSSIKVGPFSGCGIEIGTHLGFCWGVDTGYLSIAPRGRLRDLAVSIDENCGIQENGQLICRGEDPWKERLNRPEGLFSSMSLGHGHGCAISSENRTIECWESPGNPFEDFGQWSPPNGEYQQLAVGLMHSCALDFNNQVTCWGNNQFGQSSPPAVPLIMVNSGRTMSCGINSSKELVCWGANEVNQRTGLDTVPFGEFIDVAVGQNHACALKVDHTIVCWGSNIMGKSDPPEGRFRSVKIDSNGRYACALSYESSEVMCWGVVYQEQGAPSDNLSPNPLHGRTPRF